jgi:hypothetical protein
MWRGCSPRADMRLITPESSCEVNWIPLSRILIENAIDFQLVKFLAFDKT